MEIKDFKEMSERHVKTCHKIIEEDGVCVGIKCENCPFYCFNSVEDRGCQQYGESNESFVKSAKEFIELYNSKDIKVDEKRNSVNLDMNMFTMEFGKMKVSTDKHFNKVYEEFYELVAALDEYAYDKIEPVHPAEEEEDRKKLCDEALDMVQASISFAQHLIEKGIMTNEDIEAWKVKLEDRKEKYLK